MVENNNSAHVGCILDTGLHACHSSVGIPCQWNLDSGLRNSGFQSPGFWIPQAKISRIPKYGLTYGNGAKQFVTVVVDGGKDIIVIVMIMVIGLF